LLKTGNNNGATLISLLSTYSLVLTAVIVFGIVAYSIIRRRNEKTETFKTEVVTTEKLSDYSIIPFNF
jgi:hypothetical protein